MATSVSDMGKIRRINDIKGVIQFALDIQLGGKYVDTLEKMVEQGYEQLSTILVTCNDVLSKGYVVLNNNGATLEQVQNMLSEVQETINETRSEIQMAYNSELENVSNP